MSLPENYIALRYKNNGLVNETLKLEKPGKDQVVVKIEFAPIHPSDNDMMKGLYTIDLSRPGLLGSEASGVIAAVGEDLKVPHKVGDRVAIIGFGAYAQYVTLKSEDAIPLTDNLSLEEASLHFINPGTVYEMGIRAEEEGHKAAINTAASSALGRLLIKLFKHKGIKLINVVRNDKYIEELKKEGADYVLNSQSPTFEKDLKELIDKEGVTLAFDGVGGDSVEQLLRLLPEYGTCYGYGNLSLSSHTKFNFIVPIIGEKTFRGLGFSTYYRKLTREGKNLSYMKDVHSLLPTVLKQDIEKVFKVEDVKDAMTYFDEKKPQGKILLKF